VGLCGFSLAAAGGYSTIFADDSATIISDMAHVVGLLVGSEGVSGAADGHGVAPEGVSSSVWAVYSRLSSVCADGSATVISDVVLVVGLLGGSSGGWDASGGVVDELGGTETRSGGAIRCSRAVKMGRVVVVVVDVVVDGGCAGVVSGDAADSGGVDWLLVVLLGAVGEPEGSERCGGGVVVLYFDVFVVAEVVGRRLVCGFSCLDPVSVSGVR
jgi:hypothetical protein